MKDFSFQSRSQVLPSATFQKLDELVREGLADKFPAVALAVFHRDKVLLDTAWGWVDPDTQQYPVTPDTRFDLASVTKLFVTSAFLSAVSEGRVKLDDPVVSVIPEFGAVNPRPIDGGQDPHTKETLPTPPELARQTVDPSTVTFSHLLTHTSGLSPWRDVYRSAGAPPAPPDQIDSIPRAERWANGLHAICNYAFVDYPGNKVRYSDLGLMLLGEAASRLYGTPGEVDRAVQERVLNPLGLTSTTYNPMQVGVERSLIAPTENDPTWRKRRAWGEVHDENACGVVGIAGHAGLFATAGDVMHFGVAWLKNDPRLGLDADLMETAKQEHANTDGERRGLGWVLKAHENSSAGDLFHPTTFGHTGFTGTSLWIEPQRELVVACLTNAVYGGREKMETHPFRRAVHTLLAEGVEAL